MLNYQNRQNNSATFETLAEVCANAPTATAGLSGNARFPRIANPAFKDFPQNILYFYRSPDLYGGETAARNNTVFVVFSDKRLETKDAAYSMIHDLGLVDLINTAIGNIILVMPEKDSGYTEDDLQHAYIWVNALFTQKATVEIDGVRYCPAESEYCGGYGKNYFFGIGQGATFMNNFIAGSRAELSERIAGFFTFGGEMSDTVTVNGYIPAFLVNASEVAVRKFREANGCNAYSREDTISTFFNQALPLRKVSVVTDPEGTPGKWMIRAYQEMFMFLQRSSNVSTPYLEPSVTNPYQGFVSSPSISRFALSARNPILNNRTVIGNLQVSFIHDSDRFSDLKVTENKAEGMLRDLMTDENDYLDAWYEVLPQNVLDNTAPSHSVPLLLANHGGGDDVLMFLDETGILLTAGQQQFAIVAGMHSGLTFIGGELVGEALSRLVLFMLEKYPALDPERVYITGYSMGGMASYNCLAAHPELFAAAAPMAMPFQGIPEGTAEKFDKLNMPIMLLTSTFDFAAWDSIHNHINDGAQFLFRTYTGFNEISIPESFDFIKYPFIGLPSDSLTITTVNGEWRNFEWLLRGSEGYPMMGLNVTEFLQHSLWPGYGDIAWAFLKHYRRDSNTGATIFIA